MINYLHSRSRVPLIHATLLQILLNMDVTTCSGIFCKIVIGTISLYYVGKIRRKLEVVLNLTFVFTGSFWEVTLGKKVTQQTHIHSS